VLLVADADDDEPRAGPIVHVTTLLLVPFLRGGRSCNGESRLHSQRRDRNSAPVRMMVLLCAGVELAPVARAPPCDPTFRHQRLGFCDRISAPFSGTLGRTEKMPNFRRPTRIKLFDFLAANINFYVDNVKLNEFIFRPLAVIFLR